MACSNIMVRGVPSPSSSHISGRLHHYIIFIKTWHLFLLYLWLIRIPPLIPGPYALLFPPSHNRQGYCLSLLCHWNIKNWLHVNLLGHTVVTACDVLPNLPQPCIRHPLAYGGVGGGGGCTSIFHSGTKASGHKSVVPPNYEGSPAPAVCGVVRTMTKIQRSGYTIPHIRRTSQRYWCQTPPVPTGLITIPISSALSGSSGQQWRVTVVNTQHNDKVFEGIHILKDLITFPELRSYGYPGSIGGIGGISNIGG